MRTRVAWKAALFAVTWSLLPSAGCDLLCDTDCVCEDTDTDVDDTGQQYKAFLYVLIRDLEESRPNEYGTNGVEIDGVELIHAGTSNYADVVEYISFGSGETDFTDQNQVLGMPEGTCENSDGNFVSLGGSGGTGGNLIVSFETPSGDPQEIATGDQVVVHECGDTVEEYSVFIGVETSPTAPYWQICGQSMIGVASCTVPELPMVPED